MKRTYSADKYFRNLVVQVKKLVDTDIFKTSRNSDTKIIKPIKIKTGPPTRIRNREHLEYLYFKKKKKKKKKCSREAGSVRSAAL